MRLGYADRLREATSREVEPMGCVGQGGHWYLVAWCRLREGVRAFRGDRITAAEDPSVVRQVGTTPIG